MLKQVRKITTTLQGAAMSGVRAQGAAPVSSGVTAGPGRRRPCAAGTARFGEDGPSEPTRGEGAARGGAGAPCGRRDGETDGRK